MKSFLIVILLLVSATTFGSSNPDCTISSWIYNSCSPNYQCKLRLDYKNPTNNDAHSLEFYWDKNVQKCDRVKNVKLEEHIKSINIRNSTYIMGFYTNYYAHNQGDPAYCEHTCGRKTTGRASAHLRNVQAKLTHSSLTPVTKNNTTYNDVLDEKVVGKVEVGYCDCKTKKFYLQIR